MTPEYEAARLKACRESLLRAYYGTIMDNPKATVSIPGIVHFKTAESASLAAFDAGVALGEQRATERAAVIAERFELLDDGYFDSSHDCDRNKRCAAAIRAQGGEACAA